MKKRILALTLAIIMCVAMVAGCSSDGAQPASDAPAAPAESSDGQASADTPSESGESEIVELTLLCDVGFYIEDIPFYETDVGKEIERLTGIRVNLLFADNEMLTVLSAGGELPDIILTLDLNDSFMRAMYDSQQIIALDDLLQSRGQNILKHASVGIEKLNAMFGDGKTYFLPAWVTELNLDAPRENSGDAGFFTRFDLYQDIGAPAMNNEDDYLQMLKQMMEAYPTSPLGNKTYGLSLFIDWGPLWCITTYPASYGYATLAGPHYYSRLDGSATSSYLDPDSILWKGIEFFFKANQLGVLDPEGLVQEWPEHDAKVRDGEVFTGYAYWNTLMVYPDNVNGEEAGMYILPGAFPVTPDVFQLDDPIGYGANQARAITTSCKNPERAMDLLDFLCTDEGVRLVTSGVEGSDWGYGDDGVPWLSEELMYGEYELALNKGIDILQYYMGGFWKHSDGYPCYLMTAPHIIAEKASKEPEVKRFVSHYGMPDAYPGQVYEKWIDDGITQSPVDFVNLALYMPALSDETAQTYAMADDYIGGNLGNLILASDKAAFDAERSRIIGELINMGVDKADEEVFSAYNEVYNTYWK